MSVQYEAHKYRDNRFPIIFHTDQLGHSPAADHQPPGKRIITADGVQFHWHEAIEILRIIDGDVEVRINEETVMAVPGDIVVINSDRLHMIAANRASALYDCLIINREICGEWGIDLSERTFLPHIRDAVLLNLFDDISREYVEKKDGYKQMVMAKCTETMIRLNRCFRGESGNEAAPSVKKVAIVQRIIRYMSENFSRAITLDSVSAELGYSRFYLSHVFAEYTGMSVMEYLLQLRISAAQKLLENNENSIQAVASACGYRNLSSFSVVFRKRTGCTPSQYRSRQLMKQIK